MTAQPPAKQFLPTLQRSATNAFAPIQRQFNRLFDELGAGWTAFADFDLAPRMDVTETRDAVEMTVELPGLTQDDVTISVEDDRLTVSGEKKAEKETREGDYRVSERSYGAFSRSITLPRSVDAGKIKASMADGVLTITAPKNGGVATKTIKIQSAKSSSS